MTASGRRISVLIVVPRLEIGGAERHLLQVLPRLDPAVFDVQVFPLRAGGSLEERYREAGVTVLPAPQSSVTALRLLGALFLLVRLYRKRPIAHFFLPEAYLVGGLSSIFVRPARRVMSRRSLNNYQRRFPVLARLERWMHRRMDAICANSQMVMRQVIEEEGAPAAKTRLIYNGVALPDRSASAADRARLRRDWGVDENCTIFAVLANLIPYKGHRDLIAACARLDPKANWRVLLIGADSAGIQPRLAGQIAASGLEGKIRFCGKVEDVWPLLAASDAGLLTSHEEGFSNAVLECMAMGLPMVATDVGGNAEAVTSGETGILMPARDIEGIAAAMQRLIDSPDLRRQMGAAAAHRVAAHFSIESCATAYERLYRELRPA